MLTHAICSLGGVLQNCCIGELLQVSRIYIACFEIISRESPHLEMWEQGGKGGSGCEKGIGARAPLSFLLLPSPSLPQMLLPVKGVVRQAILTIRAYGLSIFFFFFSIKVRGINIFGIFQNRHERSLQTYFHNMEVYLRMGINGIHNQSIS